ncbi:hypothetical protein OOZ15_07505 [Galbibacter sp. EGI 63066]|uniref:hypothetical protein n=1 Tax=Galbibacter sp. EGI 63066 TaxID=2993559 RepID=UPI0022499D39|nr:hypothetical protein [Galbibacter sp. EGI 63066]MCX2679778.1 hypothetical protein [Galbibacter sp. EGI 63066]
MEKQSSLVKELAQLNPLIGKWTIKGSFKNNPDKHVEGWEVYKVIDEGSTLLCEWETITIWPKDKDVYKNSMDIVYDKEEAKIIGSGEWVFSFNKGVLIIENRNMRFTGTINASNDTITGKWEVKDKSGKWNYWYDKTLTKIVTV